MLELTDTHCHIHEAFDEGTFSSETRERYKKAGSPSPEAMIDAAHGAGVSRLLCVGTTLADSELAIGFVAKRANLWASIGIHPHESKDYVNDTEAQRRFAGLAGKQKVVAVGECGLDYFYTLSSQTDQERILRFQIELALKHNLPMIFHVRDAFRGFWPIFDSYPGIRGVIHSFSSDQDDLQNILERGLYVGLNGIATFTKKEDQIAAIKAVPLSMLVLETDAPFLTPTPYRGKLCEPKHVRVTAEFLSELRGESLEEIAARTTENANKLFNLR